MNRYRGRAWVLGPLLALLLLGLSACGGAPSEEPAETPPSQTAQDDPALDQLRDTLTQANALCGVAYLGDTAPDGSLTQLLTEYEKTFCFLQEIPSERTLIQPGQEVYALVPAAPDIQMTVRTWTPEPGDYVRGEAGKVLYEAADGQPVLLVGSDGGFPNVQVTVQSASGEEAAYAPCLSPCAAELDLPENSGFYEFSQVDPVQPDEAGETLSGTWSGNGLTLSLQTDGTLTLDQADGTHRTGTFYTTPDGTVSFELNDASGPAFWGIYTLTLQDSGTLTVTHIDGDPLTPDTAHTALDLPPV